MRLEGKNAYVSKCTYTLVKDIGTGIQLEHLTIALSKPAELEVEVAEAEDLPQ